MRPSRKRAFDLMLGLSLAAALVTLRARAQGGASFETDVAPILRTSCAGCHSAATRSSGFSIETAADVIRGGARHSPAVHPGNPGESPLIGILTGRIKPMMPLGAPPLDEAQVQTVANWIASLPPDETLTQDKTWWAFETPQRPEPPQVDGDVGAIDRFLRAKLTEAGLTPAPPADKRTLIRRATFDLIGLPPTPAVSAAFLADEAPDAYERLIERLLADPRYGERWGRHWLDVARYADTEGFEGDMEKPHMWRYRDYVVRSFNEDKPYDRFVREQIAGDEIDPRNPEALIAAGFLQLGAWHPIGVAEEARQALLNEMTATVGSVFLGLTMKCAQCHDHKYDPISQKDYYRLQAFFSPIELAVVDAPFRDAEMARRMRSEEQTYAAKLDDARRRLEDYEKSLLPELERSLSADGKDVSGLKPDDVAAHLVRQDAGIYSPSLEGPFGMAEKQRYLELFFEVEEGTRRTLRDKGSAVRRMERYQAKAHSVRNFAFSTSAPSPPRTFVRLGGEYNRLGEIVQAGVPHALLGESTDLKPPEETPTRKPLADWIASPRNPLTARVMVNRIWQQHFGFGLVATPSDFGRNGAPPSHPELLDWLAVEFVKSGWSVKHMHRLMMTSYAYRQASSREDEAASKADPANRLLWRMNRKRLEAESVRDSILAISGRLSPARGGPGYFPKLPGDLGQTLIKNKKIWEDDAVADGPSQRSIYVFQRRQLKTPMLDILDGPDLDNSCARRTPTVTPIQSLALMNSAFVDAEARACAQRVAESAPGDVSAQLTAAFELALARPPEEAENREMRTFLEGSSPETGLRSVCRVLMNSNEFAYVD